MITQKGCDIEILPFTLEDLDAVFVEKEIEIVLSDITRIKPNTTKIVAQLTSTSNFDILKLEVTRIKPST